jgi:hypothetical protein
MIPNADRIHTFNYIPLVYYNGNIVFGNRVIDYVT